jgi:broad specificity phosphatase PhoE
MIKVVFETHSLSEDNEAGIASGWSHSLLSAGGREAARQVGERRTSDGIAAVFASDLRRAAETAQIAFADTTIPVFLDWHLRECDYGERNATPADRHARDRQDFLHVPYPGGESWRQAVTRVGRFLEDLPTRWDRTRVLIIGHVATRWALEHYLAGRRLEDLINDDFHWREGWEYTLHAQPHAQGHRGLTLRE